MESTGRTGRDPSTDPRREPRVHDDMAHLTTLVDDLQGRQLTRPLDDRALELTGGVVAPDVAEQQLRAITALLLTLDTYLRVRRSRTARVPRAGSPAGPPTATPARRNGTPTPARPPEGLAAAAARYIARDLAARQLSEFTSAEGYRLARELARIGGDEDAVEELLNRANQIRLHPVSLTDALSHSPR